MKLPRVLLGVLCAALGACDISGVMSPSSPPSGAGGGNGSTGNPPGADPTKARVRIAHLSPDAPRVDACVSARGSGKWVGPVAAALDGLAFGDVTGYLPLAEGAYDVRLVAAGADCTTGLLPDITTLPALNGGLTYTLAALGELMATPATFEVKAFLDDARANPLSVKLRFIHAAAGIPAVDVGTGAGAQFSAVFSAVAFASIGQGINGYVEVPTLSRATLSARVTGTLTDALVLSEVSVPAGRSITVFAVGRSPLRALWCEDSTSGARSTCAFMGATGNTMHPTDPMPPAMRAGLRVAHLSPGAPAVDVCASVRGSGNWKGPLLGGAGLSYGEVTAYLPLDPDTYDVRIVAPGAANCSTALAGLPDVTDLPRLYEGTFGTVAATGVLSGPQQAFRVRAFLDERAAPAGAARLRFIHASPGTPAVDVGAGQGLSFAPLYSNIPYGGIAHGLAYSNGYLSVPGLSDAVVSARVTGTPRDSLSVGGISLPVGATATAFAIGLIGSSDTPLKVLLCVDSGAMANGRSTCVSPAAAPEPARLRIAHLSPDAPAVDVCIAKHGTSAFVGPVAKSLGVAAGLSYPLVSAYLPLSPGQYDVRIVAPNAADCSTRLAGLPDTVDLPALGSGASATVAAIGELAGGFRLTAFLDRNANQVPAGKIAFRFIHAAPGTGPVDVGLGTGATFVPTALDNSFGTTKGYVERDPFNGHTWLEVRVTGTVHAALSFGGVATDAGNAATLFAIGKAGTSNALKPLYCRDTAPAVGVLSACHVLQ